VFSASAEGVGLRDASLCCVEVSLSGDLDAAGGVPLEIGTPAVTGSTATVDAGVVEAGAAGGAARGVVTAFVVDDDETVTCTVVVSNWAAASTAEAATSVEVRLQPAYGQ